MSGKTTLSGFNGQIGVARFNWFKNKFKFIGVINVWFPSWTACLCADNSGIAVSSSYLNLVCVCLRNRNRVRVIVVVGVAGAGVIVSMTDGGEAGVPSALVGVCPL
ncbi:MAG: hypothetical protein CEN91_284 [Candidatus Berkelbacteria bacterium Licking1014_85]|uniref:Uncharacterized protein n=1 Tax=Candidatus Berkelbacteria bacterium Licking1014_85 TaxID=2017148 RepID=A0A554LJV9_9BACT|nr:MAG: hypothetical protein CEN91_284 [Candidatus Berkelbacteria bacterium Licking1014_85]